MPSDKPTLFCPVQTALDVIGGKWKIELIWYLLEGKQRPSQLKKLINGISERMMTQQLRELEEDKIVERIVYPEVPPKVDYQLTAYGHTLKPLLTSLEQWGKTHQITHSPVSHQHEIES